MAECSSQVRTSLTTEQKQQASIAINENAVDKKPTKKDVPERDTWAGKLDFILSCVGYCIGLGNVWRFPYLCYENGGGAFLLPYLLMLFLAGTPMYVLEASLGQLTSSGVLGCWQMCPVFKGVGYGATVMAFWLNLYYIILLAWAAFYLVHSFQSPLPWASCQNWWNTAGCYEDSQIIACRSLKQEQTMTLIQQRFTQSSNFLMNTTVMPLKTSIMVTPSGGVRDDCLEQIGANGTASVREFWIRYALQKSNGIEEPGELRWQLALCLLAMWTLCYFCIWKGVKWTGKVVYFTAIFPYVLLIVLFFRAITLPGAIDGVIYYVYPRFDAMLNSQVWIKAATQIFFSHGLGVGAVIALGSYNRFSNNVYRDAIMLSAVDCCTAVFAGLVVFATVGFMAQVRGEDVSKVAASGPGLAFLAYPAAVSQLPWAPLWAVLFFIMIILLGIDSQFCTVEGFITAWCDEFPRQLRRNKEAFLAVICVISFGVGLAMVTQGGIYVFDLIDHYSQTMTLLFVIFAECVGIAWAYGVDNFCDDIALMIGYQPFAFWRYAWKYFTPTICAGVAIYSFVFYKPLVYEEGPNHNYDYPGWSLAVGWAITLTTQLPIVIYTVVLFVRTPGDFKTRLRLMFRPGRYMNPNKEKALADLQLRQRGDEKDQVQVPLLPQPNNNSNNSDDSSKKKIDDNQITIGA